MPRGYLSVRIDTQNPLHHVWLNNGVFWVHYTLNFDFRTRRVRRSLKTSDPTVAIARRDELFARLRKDGEKVSERRTHRRWHDDTDVATRAEVQQAVGQLGNESGDTLTQVVRRYQRGASHESHTPIIPLLHRSEAGPQVSEGPQLSGEECGGLRRKARDKVLWRQLRTAAGTARSSAERFGGDPQKETRRSSHGSTKE